MSKARKLPKWFLPSYKTLLFVVFGLIALGGSVRLMNAGLACPDWPLCFGALIPDFHPQVYFEFIHRVVAGFVGIATIVLQTTIFRSSASRSVKWTGVLILLLLFSQVIFGGLTVLLKLHSKVVATHLAMGTGFFALLTWQYMSLKDLPKVKFGPRWLVGLSVILGVLIYGQVILGGLVASHYASLACSDFPTCHGQWFPTFKGIIGLHVIHRLGAYTVFLATLLTMILIFKKSKSEELKRLSSILFALVVIQMCIGIANVLFYTPPLIAVIHLSVATGLLGVATRQVHMVTR